VEAVDGAILEQGGADGDGSSVREDHGAVGVGVFAVASVVDGVTNDPTTVTMQR
jgi:hypothetical protein